MNADRLNNVAKALGVVYRVNQDSGTQAREEMLEHLLLILAERTKRPILTLPSKK